MTVEEAEEAYIKAYATWQAEEWKDGLKSLKHRLFGMRDLEIAAQALEKARAEEAGLPPPPAVIRYLHVGDRTYLGDGLYAAFDGYHVVLTTNNGIEDTGIEDTNTVFLEPAVLMAFMTFLQHLPISGGDQVEPPQNPDPQSVVSTDPVPPSQDGLA